MITHDGTITFTHTNGRIHNVIPAHPSYGAVKRKLREVQADPENERLRLSLYDLSQPVNIVKGSSKGRVVIENGQVLYNGTVVRNFVADRIMWMVGEGFDASPMLAFLENVKENPSNRAVEELYRFMDHNRMGLTKDGMILAYKRVKSNYKDIYTGTIDNSVGLTVTMPRNEVNDNPEQTCSHGLHVCSMEYLPNYGANSGNKVVICEIHPKNVVSVPVDYNNAKMRVCEYRVIDEITGDLTDILGTRAIHYSEPDDNSDSWQDWSDDSCDWCGTYNSDCDCEDEEIVERVSAAPTRSEYRVARTPVPIEDVFDFNAFVRNVQTKVYRVIREALDAPFISDTDTLRSLNADALDATSLAIDLEVEFGLSDQVIDEGDISPDTTVKDIIGMVMKLTA